MITFKKSGISTDNKTVGDTLRSARTEQGLSLQKATKKTKIKSEYLKALENGDYSKLPIGMYEKKYLKEYATFLGLDSERLLKDFQKEKQITSSPDTVNLSFFSKNKLKKSHFVIFPRIIKNVIIILVVTVCFGYLGFCVKNFMSPPQLSIENPQNNLVTDQNQIAIKGETEPGAQIYINGNSVLTSNTGEFIKKIALKKGVNTITIAAQKKYSREKVLKKQILVK